MTVKFTTRVKYFKGFYDPSRPEFTTDTLNKDGISAVAQFLPESCILKLFKLIENNSVQIVDEKNPHDVLDLGLAQVTQSAVALNNQQGSVVSVSNIAGHGVNTLIFVFETPKKSKEWCYVVKEAQDSVGLDAPRAEGTKISQKNKHYCSELAQFCEEFGVRSEDVLKEKITAVENKKEELKSMISHNEIQFARKTAQIQSRDFQIQLKEKNVAALKAELEALKPRHQYKYIIPYIETKSTEEESAVCSVEDCVKLAEKRANTRRTSWKVYDQSDDDNLLVNDMLRLARLDKAKQSKIGTSTTTSVKPPYTSSANNYKCILPLETFSESELYESRKVARIIGV